jgi:hypothetical protein
MTTDLELNKGLSVIDQKNASEDAITKALPTYEDLTDPFTDLADDKAKVEATFRLIVHTIIVSDIDISRVVFDCFLANIVDPDFAWANFTHAMSRCRQSRQNDHGRSEHDDRTHQQYDHFFYRCANIGCQTASNTSYAQNDCHPETSTVVEVTVCGVIL